MASYEEIFKSKVDWAKPFQRTGKFPLDRTDLFSSYEDAVKYAKGDRTDPDSRGLAGTSYIGQIITVFENDVVTAYQIQADRSLKELGKESVHPVGIVKEQLVAGELEKVITLPEGSIVTSTVIKDSTTGEIIYTDVSATSTGVTISLAEAYINTLDIVVSYQLG